MRPFSSRPSLRAFTLIELLVVITIVAVLAGIALPVFGSIQLVGRKTQSLSNMKQLGAALLLYCGQNEGVLPQKNNNGNKTPSWAVAADVTSTPQAAQVWYNALPKLGGFPAMTDFQNDHAGFYTKKNLLYVPAAKYPANKLSAPMFAVSFNSKLVDGLAGAAIADADVRLPNFQQPAHTVVFLESGLTGESPTNIPGVSSSTYTSQCMTYADRAIARYTGQTILTFADGHSEALAGSDIVDKATGKCYFPQMPATPPASGPYGKVLWTMMPDGDPR